MLMKFVLTQPLDEAAMNVLKEAGADVYIANSPDLPSYIDKIQEADALVIRVGPVYRRSDRCLPEFKGDRNHRCRI